MNYKSQQKISCQKMQTLLQQQLEAQTQLKQCEQTLDLFETFYLQNSWRTGNIYLGWPICSYNEITQFMNRPVAKRTIKSYIEIQEHQKLFSLSSLTSVPFAKISRINYLATKELYHQSRPKIFRLGRKPAKSQSKLQVKSEQKNQVNQSSQKISKIMTIKEEEFIDEDCKNFLIQQQEKQKSNIIFNDGVKLEQQKMKKNQKKKSKEKLKKQLMETNQLISLPKNQLLAEETPKIVKLESKVELNHLVVKNEPKTSAKKKEKSSQKKQIENDNQPQLRRSTRKRQVTFKFGQQTKMITF